MWGQQDQQDQQEENSSEQVEQVEKTGKSIIAPAAALSKLDDKFEELYNNIVGNLNTTNTYSSKLQSIEIQHLSQQLSSKDVSNDSSSVTEEEELNNNISHLLNSSSNDILGNLGEVSVPSERKKRYEFYDEISNINYIAYRMLKVYLDNILIKNVQTKQFLNINPNSDNVNFLSTIKDDIGKHYENFLKTCSVFFDLQKKLKNKIVPDMLRYGNSFIEVLNLVNVAKIASKTELITESFLLDNPTKSQKEKKGQGLFLFESIGFDSQEIKTTNIEKVDLTPSQQFMKILSSKKGLIQEDSINYYSQLQEENSEYKFDDIKNLDFDALQNIYLKNISPNQVIIIENDGILYGYLVVEELEKGQGTEIDVFKRFTQQDDSSSASNNIQKEVIESMTKGVIKKINSTINSNAMQDFEQLGLSDNIESSIKIILYHKIKEKSKLKFRFLSPSKLVNFSTGIDKFGPYGTSIFDPVIQPVKMYTLALMSSIVSRLSRASVVRKWTIEAGNKKNHAGVIEKLKKDIGNKSISFDSLSDVKNVSKVITDFRDLATIQVNGQKFIDMEVMPMGDRALPMNDMNDLRNELIAATGIPSVYLNIGDQVDLRETLVNLNTSFATTISSHQGNIDESLAILLNSIFGIILENNDYSSNDFLLSNYYSFSLNPPLVLTVQANEALISSVTNIIGMLKSSEVTIDPVELLKLYIPQMNWDDLLKTGEKFIKKLAKEQLTAQTEDQTQNF